MTTADYKRTSRSRVLRIVFLGFPVSGAACASVLSVLRITGTLPVAFDWGMIAVLSVALATLPVVLYAVGCVLCGALLLILLTLAKIVDVEVHGRPGFTKRARRQFRVCTRHFIAAYWTPGIVLLFGSFLGALFAVRYMRPDLDWESWSLFWRALLLWLPAVVVLARPLAMFSDYTMPKRHREKWRRIRRRHL